MYLKSPGYHGYVTALCGEQGNYTVSGRCVPVLCGTPPRLPEAAARMEDVTRQNFSFGALVHYDCKKPRHGDVRFLLGFPYFSLQKPMDVDGNRRASARFSRSFGCFARAGTPLWQVRW